MSAGPQPAPAGAIRRRPTLLAALAYLAIVVGAFSPVFLLGRSYHPPLFYPYGATEAGPWDYDGRTPVNLFNLDLADAAYNIWPLNRAAGDLLRDGHVPLWNPHQGAGHPLAAQYSTRVFFPYQILESLSPAGTWDFFLLGRLWIAGLLTFLFLRQLGARPPAAVFGGLCYMLSGTFGWFLWLEQILNGAMLMPLLFLSAERIARTGGAGDAALGALSVGLILLGGQPETALYILAAAGVFFVFRAVEHHGSRMMRPALVFASSGVLGAALAAPQLLPFYEHVGLSFHLHPAGGDMGVRDPVPWSWLSAILFPTLYSLPRPPTVTPLNGLWDHVGGYVGVAPLLAAAFGARAAAPPLRRLILLFLGIGAVLLLKHAGVAPFVWIGHLPLFDQSWSQRYGGPVWTFCFAVAAGLGAAGLFGAQTFRAPGPPADDAAVRARAARGLALLALLPPAFLTAFAAGRADQAALWAAAAGLSLTVLAVGHSYARSGVRRPAPTGAPPSPWPGERVALPVKAVVAAAILLPAALLLPWALPLLPSQHSVPNGPALAVVLLLPVVAAATLLEVRRRAGLKLLSDPLALGALALPALALALALAHYPLVREHQRAFFEPLVLAGGAIGLATAALGTVVVLRHASNPAGLLALGALAVAELWFALPRGYPPAEHALIGLVWLLCPIAVWGLLTARRAVVAGAALGAVLGSVAIDLGADRGLPDRADPFAAPPYVGWLAGQEPGFRTVGAGGVLMPNIASAFGLEDAHYIQAVVERSQHAFAQEHLQEAPSLVGNVLWFTGVPVRDFRNLSPALSLWYRDLGAAFPPTAYSDELAVERFKHSFWANHRAYGLISVRYVLLPSWADLNPPPRVAAERGLPVFPLVYDAEIRIFENPAALPRAYLVHETRRATDADAAQTLASDPSFPADRQAVVETAVALSGGGDAAPGAAPRIVEDRPNAVTVEVATGRPGLLVLSDLHYPGWTAEIDGRDTGVLRVNGLGRGVVLEPGRHRVRFRYRPDSFRLGLVVCAAAALGLGLLAGRSIRRRRPV